jgi:hypothetical protein
MGNRRYSGRTPQLAQQEMQRAQRNDDERVSATFKRKGEGWQLRLARSFGYELAVQKDFTESAYFALRSWRQPCPDAAVG